MTFKHVTSPTQATTYVPKKKKFLEEICWKDVTHTEKDGGDMFLQNIHSYKNHKASYIPNDGILLWNLVCKQTISTEVPLLAGEISAIFWG
jgi:hypothetical protein